MQPRNSNTPNASTRTLTMLGVAFMGAGLAMFMWWKMRMVTGVPRTAYAEPRAVQPPPAPDAQAPQHAATHEVPSATPTENP